MLLEGTWGCSQFERRITYPCLLSPCAPGNSRAYRLTLTIAYCLTLTISAQSVHFIIDLVSGSAACNVYVTILN